MSDRAAGPDEPTLALGGRPGDPAITWHGRTLDYAGLRGLIDSSRIGAPLDVSALPLPEALACLFAATRAGTSVLVRDPSAPAPTLGALPPGTWLVACTSGSTEAPRAVCRTGASWAASVAPLASLAGLDAGDRVLLTGPVHATLHLHAAVHTLAIGAELTDDPSAATAVHCVPAVLASLLDTLPDAAPLRTTVVAGAPLPQALAARAEQRGWAVTEYYGAAELSFVAARRLPDPVLRPFPGVRVRVDSGGMLWAHSPYLALGYAGDPTNADAHRGAGNGGGPALDEPDRRLGGSLRLDADGYATVGDLAEIVGNDGSNAGGGTAAEPGLLVRGRGETAVTTGGFTVLVEEVEAALELLAGVRAAAVVGVPHPRLGEVVTAVLELEPGTDLATVRAAARQRLAGPARPRRYVAVDALPRLAGGKLARAALSRHCAS